MQRAAKRKRTASVVVEAYNSDDEDQENQPVEQVANHEVRGSRGNVSIHATVVNVPISNPPPPVPTSTAPQSEGNTSKNAAHKEVPHTHSPPDSTLKEWTEHYRTLYMDELLRLMGRAGAASVCSCGGEAKFRCQDCIYGNLRCAKCTITQHSLLPCHRIEKWEGTHFEHASLSELGLVVQLLHDPSSPCRQPGEKRQIYLIDISGHHTITTQLCRCQGLPDQVQFLRMSWFPASLHEPRTVFTFEALNTFHILTLQSKISAYDFCQALERKTSDSHTVKNRYDQFLYCIRVYRHLLLLLKGGIGQSPAGVSDVKPGDLAVDCPACPHPGINLPDGWENASEDMKWLYTLRLTIDANFRLKNKDRNITHDHPLGDGWAYWVPLRPYMEHVEANKGQAEPNLCDSDLRAIDHANSKRSAGYLSTGVGGVVCARHGLVRKNGMGSLQVGERYSNMDFIVLYTLKSTQVQQLVLSYDIACQWFRNLRKRMIEQHPPDRHLPSALLAKTTIMIPKFHIYGHGHSCQVRYSSNFLPWSAQTDGEDPERWWAHINPVSMSTRLMGPGSRLDTIDDHTASWNEQKILGFGDSLSERLRVALILSKQQSSLHAQFSASFPDDTVATWEAMVVSWERNPRRTNPFDDGVVRSTLADVRLALAQEDDLSTSLATPEMSPHQFVYQGMELEEDQRALKASVQEQSTLQALDTQEKRNVLARRILAWLKLQAVYMPNLPHHYDPKNVLAEQFKLPLPSFFPTTTETASLRGVEIRLRVGQADDAITELKRLLRVHAGLKDHKVSQAGSGQGANTRMRALMTRYQAKVNLVADRYRAAYGALVHLDANGTWTERLRVLEVGDIRWPKRQDNESESRRELSWIWLSNAGAQNIDPAIAASTSDMDISLRAEWSRSRARAHRWQEEIQLVHEEMRRVLQYLQWKAVWWKSRASLRADLSDDLGEGVSAHAHREAALVTTLRNVFLARWSPQTSAEGMQLP